MSFTNIETEAFIVSQPGDDFKLTPIVLDEVRGNEVLVEIKYSGICHTVRRHILHIRDYRCVEPSKN